MNTVNHRLPLIHPNAVDIGYASTEGNRLGIISVGLNREKPNVALPSVPGTHRLIHLHKNVPGVLASINRVLADHGVNVEGQLLRTRDDLGYVITDIGTQYSDEVLDELRAMDVTIRLRTIEWE